MHQQPSEPRKYQLFPQKDKLSIAAGRKTPELETAQAMTQNASGERERSILGAALRLKSKEQTLIRRRKASVPELGPMTTVQEVPMDSRESSSQLSHRYRANELYQRQYPGGRHCMNARSVHPGIAGDSICLGKACYLAYPDLH